MLTEVVKMKVIVFVAILAILLLVMMSYKEPYVVSKTVPLVFCKYTGSDFNNGYDPNIPNIPGATNWNEYCKKFGFTQASSVHCDTDGTNCPCSLTCTK